MMMSTLWTLLWTLLLSSLLCSHGNPNYDPRRIQISNPEVLTRPLHGIVILHAEGWDSTRPRGSNWLRDTIWPAPRFIHISINDHQIMPCLEQNKTAPHVLPTVLVYNVENSGTDALYRIPRALIALYNIKMVFNPSDEWKAWGKKYFYGEGTELYPLVSTVLREYSVLPYRDQAHPHQNVIQMPLNYVDCFLHEPRPTNSSSISTNSSIYRNAIDDSISYLSGIDVMRNAMQVKAADRHYLWAFVGSLQGANKGYQERHTVVTLYEHKYTPSFISNHFQTSSMYEIYLNAKFVIVMKGQYNIECFRYTEASFAGAIPVVVADGGEIAREYYFEGDRPPFLYDTDYEHVFQVMSAMSNETIDEMRHNITVWYEQRIHKIHNLTVHYAQEQHQHVFGHHQYLHNKKHHTASGGR